MTNIHLTTLPYHTPVLLQEVLEWLQPQPGKLYVDATVGGGGHSAEILKKLQKLSQAASEGKSHLMAIDRDPMALQVAQNKLETMVTHKELSLFHCQFVHAPFSNLKDSLAKFNLESINGGLLVDLGVSSHQLDTAERGFSFSKPAPLDMRMDPTQLLTAETVVNTYKEEELQHIFSAYGEEHLSKTIARAIVGRREEIPFTTTVQLADLISGCYRWLDNKKQSASKNNRSSKIHAATRVFQALRMEVNGELQELERLLQSLPTVLAPGARVVIISFHSLEDRLVKHAFQQMSKNCLCPPFYPVCQCHHRASLKILTSKPVVASETEIGQNPRARSAKLRAAIGV